MKLHDTETCINFWNALAHKTNSIIILYNDWQKYGFNKNDVPLILDKLGIVEATLTNSKFNNSIFLDSLNEIKIGLHFDKILIFSKSLTRFDLLTDEAFEDLITQFENKYPNRILASTKTKEIWLIQAKGK